MDNVVIFDTTLRDGEQSPGASMNIAEKVQIAVQLQNLGVDVIEAGFAASSVGDFESIKEICRNVEHSSICSLSRCVENDIIKSANALSGAKKSRIHVFLATSPIHMQYKLKKKPDEVLKTAVNSIQLAKSYCDDIQFSAEDACRSDIAFLKEICLAAIEAGATTLNIPDTVGYILPHEMGNIIKELHSVVKNRAILSVHCHNDLGLAVGNSIYGVINGARQIECTINGLGERAGNCALEEVAMIFKTRNDELKQYGNFHVNINTKEIYKTSKLVENITGIRPQPNKAIVGKNAFSHESGIHQDGILKNKQTYEIMNPCDIGIVDNDNLVLGKHSGRAAFRDKVVQLGFELDNETLNHIFEKFKMICDNKKEVFDEDILALIDENEAIPEIFSIVSMQSNTTTNSFHSAVVSIKKGDEILSDCALGNGAIDSVFKAIERTTNIKSELLDYKVDSISKGKDATARVFVKIRFECNVFLGRANDLDTIQASAKAYINALNNFLSMKELLKNKNYDDVKKKDFQLVE